MEAIEKASDHKQPWLKIHEELGVKPVPEDNRTLAEHIADHAKERPESPALLFLDKVVGFAEYDANVSKLANALRDLGIGKGDVVGLLMSNIPQYAYALAACSRLGAVGSGLSPLFSPPELAFQIGDARIKAVIAVEEMAGKLAAISDISDSLKTVVVTTAMDDITPGKPELPEIPGVNVVAYSEVVPNASDKCEQVPVDGNDNFMIQYTGGTTGKPKGAQLTVHSIMRDVLVQTSHGAPYQPGKEVMASPYPPFHIGGAVSVMVMAVYGGLLFVLPDPRNIPQFIEYMHRFPPTRIAAVPALTEMLLDSPEFQKVDISNLGTWASGAAPISAKTIARLDEHVGKGKLTEAFGMTETSSAAIVNPPARYKYGSVGIPLPETDVRIMDVEKHDTEMPLGEPGEICISGPMVMKGYINLPDETANSLRDINGRTYMYTGDVGYMDDEGFIFLCDRAKDMLIVGGFKVFSVEVEDKLKSLPMVESSALVGKPDEARPGNDIVHLFMQLAEDHKDRDEEELRSELMAFFADNMAVYKKPKVIHFVDAIPLTPVGKIDKKKLRAELQTSG